MWLPKTWKMPFASCVMFVALLTRPSPQLMSRRSTGKFAIVASELTVLNVAISPLTAAPSVNARAFIVMLTLALLTLAVPLAAASGAAP